MCVCTPGIRTPFCDSMICQEAKKNHEYNKGNNVRYPRKITEDLIIRRHESGAPGGFSYCAVLTDGYHSDLVLGPYRDTELEAIQGLSVSLSIKAQVLKIRSEELMKMESVP